MHVHLHVIAIFIQYPIEIHTICRILYIDLHMCFHCRIQGKFLLVFHESYVCLRNLNSLVVVSCFQPHITVYYKNRQFPIAISTTENWFGKMHPDIMPLSEMYLSMSKLKLGIFRLPVSVMLAIIAGGVGIAKWLDKRQERKNNEKTSQSRRDDNQEIRNYLRPRKSIHEYTNLFFLFYFKSSYPWI